jgi:hypothetical protein
MRKLMKTNAMAGESQTRVQRCNGVRNNPRGEFSPQGTQSAQRGTADREDDPKTWLSIARF